MEDEKNLIQKCIKNNALAQKKLYDKYSPILFAICLRYSNSIEEAQDILQDGFIKIFLNIKKFSFKGSFEGWLKKIIVNTAITFYRKNEKYKTILDIDTISEINIKNINYETSEFTRDELFRVINELSPGYKMIFNLYTIEGYKHKEIAKLLNIEESTSKSQYFRAKKIIKKKLMDLKKINYEQTR